MSPRFDKLKQGGPACPSDLRLERLVAGELTGNERVDVEGHVVGCAQCSDRVAPMKRGFGAVAEADPRKMLAAIRRGGEGAPTPARARWRRWLFAAVPTCGAVLLLMMWLRPGAAPEPGTRAKGGLALHVFRQVGDGAERLVSGGKVRAGDRLRFAVDLPAAGQVAIVGVEGSGKLFAVWPLEAGTATALPAGRGHELPGAVALDDSRGRETLYLVQCAGRAPACSSTGAGRPPACGDACALSPFVLDKDP